MLNRRFFSVAILALVLVILPAGAGAQEDEGFKAFDPNNFDDPTTIDNEWFPLKPGTQFVYEGSTTEDGERVPHTIIFTVTDMTKEIAGVRALIIWDRDFSDDVMIEEELTFFAQDNAGNVWHLGQYRETWDEEEFVGGRIWVVGAVEGARAGIMMHANPQVGTPGYSEGFAPEPYNWTDFGRVYQMGEQLTIGYGSYEDVLVIEEFDDPDPDAFQLKYYARGVGNIFVGWRGEDPEQEELELVDIMILDEEEMAEVREEVYAMEERAYTYGLTPPVKLLSEMDD